jgi:hypothetical protein
MPDGLPFPRGGLGGSRDALNSRLRGGAIRSVGVTHRNRFPGWPPALTACSPSLVIFGFCLLAGVFVQQLNQRAARFLQQKIDELAMLEQ